MLSTTTSCTKFTWIAHYQHVDVSTNPMFLSRILGLSAKQRQSQSTFDEIMSVDGWGHAANDAVSDARVLAQLLNGRNVLIGQR